MKVTMMVRLDEEVMGRLKRLVGARTLSSNRQGGFAYEKAVNDTLTQLINEDAEKRGIYEEE